MAIRVNVQLTNGIIVDSAYARIEHIKISYKNRLDFTLRFFVEGNQAAFNEAHFVSAYDATGSCVIRQAYMHLKTLPEFEGSEDC